MNGVVPLKKKSKVFSSPADCLITYFKLMPIMNFSSLTSRMFALFLLTVAFSAFGSIFKRFDVPEAKQDGYLKSFRPPALALRVPNPIPADRFNLLLLPVHSFESNASDSNTSIASLPTISTEPPPVEAATTIPTEKTPLVVVTPPVVLPPSDPFDVPVNREPSTDDLIDALEREQIKSGSGVPDFLPFIPPYSAAPANLEIRSEAKYIRRPRQ